MLSAHRDDAPAPRRPSSGPRSLAVVDPVSGSTLTAKSLVRGLPRDPQGMADGRAGQPGRGASRCLRRPPGQRGWWPEPGGRIGWTPRSPRTGAAAAGRSPFEPASPGVVPPPAEDGACTCTARLNDASQASTAALNKSKVDYGPRAPALVERSAARECGCRAGRADARSVRHRLTPLADGGAATPGPVTGPWAGAYWAAASADGFAAFCAAFFRASWRACSSTGTTTSGRSRPNLLA
jgi:hypothetical protein